MMTNQMTSFITLLESLFSSPFEHLRKLERKYEWRSPWVARSLAKYGSVVCPALRHSTSFPPEAKSSVSRSTLTAIF